MNTALIVLQVIAGLTSVLIVLFVLLHRGRGGGVSDMFGGGVSSAAGASGVAEKNLNRITVWLIVMWALSIIAIGVLSKIAASVVV